MSITTIALSNKPSPPRRGVGSENSYGRAVQRTFEELGLSAVEKQREEIRLLEEARDAERKARDAAARRKEAEVLNARVVMRQMELRRERDLSSRMEEQVPGITQQFSGYPNFPETPDHERRVHKAARQQELRRQLDEQYQRQLSLRKADEAYDLLIEKQRLDQAQHDLEMLEFEKAQKRTRDREMLTKAWEDAERAKAIKARIEGMQLRGLNPRLEPINVFLKRSIGTVDDLIDSLPPPSQPEKPSSPIDDSKTEEPKPEDSPEKPSEDPPAQPPRAANNSVILPNHSNEGLEKGAHSRSFDGKHQGVALPVIQQYHASDVSHRTRVRGRLAGSIGRHVAVAQIRSRKTSQEPITRRPAPEESPKTNWTFATTNPNTTDRAISHQSAHGGRSQSQVVKPSVYIVRKYEHQKYQSRVLAETGANTLQRPIVK